MAASELTARAGTAPGAPGGPPTLSVCMLLGAHPELAAATLRRLRPAADEIVVAADARLAESSLGVVAPVADRLLRVEVGPPGVERTMPWLHSQCRGSWVLRLDVDEVVSDALLEALPGLLDARDCLAYLFPRRWCYPDARHVLDEPPWVPDWQARLVRNDPALLRFEGTLHSSVALVRPYRFVPPPIYHLDCLLAPLEDRMAKAERYERIRPGLRTEHGHSVSGTYYTPELSAALAPVALPDADRAAIEAVLAAGNADSEDVVVPLVPESVMAVVPQSAVDRLWAKREVPSSTYRARVDLVGPPPQPQAGQLGALWVSVTNQGDEVWPWAPAVGPDIKIGLRWLDPDTGAVLEDGLHTAFTADVLPGSTVIQPVDVRWPGRPGRYLLEVDVVHEMVRWFGCGARLEVAVRSPDGSVV